MTASFRPHVAVAGLRKRFGDVEALGGVDLEVRSGQIVALLGPNGAGKSTLMRILGTIVLPDAGSAIVAGYDVVEQSGDVRRCAGLMLGDERSWYWRLTGRHNLEFFAILYGLRPRAARARARRLLQDLGLDEAADRRFGTYSSGMRSRLSLARALLLEPPVLLLDEPTRNLDPEAAARFRGMVRRLVDERGSAALVATHDLHEAAELADTTLGLAKGRVAFARDRGVSAAQLEQAILATTG